MTTLTLIGNIGNAPELRFAPTGTAVLNLSVAVTRRKYVNGEWQDAGTDWHRIVTFGPKAETWAEHLNKGQRVIVVGTLESREYDKDGDKRTAWEIKATDIGIVPKAARQTTPAADPWAAEGANDGPPF